MRKRSFVGAMAVQALLLAGCGGDTLAMDERAERIGERQSIRGVWALVESHDWNPEGDDVSPLGEHASGLFVYTPAGHLSLHIMTEHERDLVSGDTSDADLGRIYRPYIGYFGAYSVDYDAMTVTHHIEGAKLPNRIGRSDVRGFRFDGGDLVLEFKNEQGWRFSRRLRLVEQLD